MKTYGNAGEHRMKRFADYSRYPREYDAVSGFLFMLYQHLKIVHFREWWTWDE